MDEKVEKVTLKERIVNFKNRQVEKVKKGWNWIKDNREVVLPMGTALVTLTATVLNVQVAKGELALKLEDRNTYDDPTTNIKWNLKRKMTNDEKIELASKVRNNEDIGNFLSEKDLLK